MCVTSVNHRTTMLRARVKPVSWHRGTGKLLLKQMLSALRGEGVIDLGDIVVDITGDSMDTSSRDQAKHKADAIELEDDTAMQEPGQEPDSDKELAAHQKLALGQEVGGGQELEAPSGPPWVMTTPANLAEGSAENRPKSWECLHPRSCKERCGSCGKVACFQGGVWGQEVY